ATTDARAGVWTASLHENDPRTLEISLFQGKNNWPGGERHGFNNIMGFDVPLSDATGLAPTDIAAQAANVQFAMTRPAGTIRFEGRFSEGNGAGSFRFAPNDDFVREMDSLGIKDLTDDDLLVLAAHDFAPQTLRELRSMGYDLATRREVVEVAIFRINAA